MTEHDAQPSLQTDRDAEWFARNDPPGLRFSCTQCGNCCSGPPGYVLVSDAESSRLAARLEISLQDFLARYTHVTHEGRSLIERRTHAGHDCIFLDRATQPGKAICAVYEDRPGQCRTWPFWPSLMKSRAAWEQAKKTCPGIDAGPLYTPVQIRLQRDAFEI